MSPYNQFIFSGESISIVFDKIYKKVKDSIESEPETDFLNMNETSFIEYLENRHIIDTPELHFDKVTSDSYETNIPASKLSLHYYAEVGTTIKKDVIQFYIPCSGDIQMLSYSPHSSRSLGLEKFFVIQRNPPTIRGEIVNYNNDPKEIMRRYNHHVESIQHNYKILVKEIGSFNENLKSLITTVFRVRKNRLLEKNNLMASLGIPLRKNTSIPSTFAVPKPELRRKIVIKSIGNGKGFTPEPTVDGETYHEILRLINDVGKNFERMPSTYKAKGEEDLRDHILLTLDPNFQMGSASGETFNKSGKTDIQLRYNSSVVFIAECKFWTGEKGYLDTITQLLGYLTWRDTKASVVIFVRQKDFTTILTKVEAQTNTHPNYLGMGTKSDENWFNFRFHINDDVNREVKLAVQLYHLPKV